MSVPLQSDALTVEPPKLQILESKTQQYKPIFKLSVVYTIMTVFFTLIFQLSFSLSQHCCDIRQFTYGLNHVVLNLIILGQILGMNSYLEQNSVNTIYRVVGACLESRFRILVSSLYFVRQLNVRVTCLSKDSQAHYWPSQQKLGQVMNGLFSIHYPARKDNLLPGISSYFCGEQSLLNSVS